MFGRLKRKTFRGGVRLPEIKAAAESRVVPGPFPARVTVPLCQHAGAPAEAVVEKGAEVVTGQLIARKSAFISAGVHSPVTGRVVSLETVRLAAGNLSPAVVIEAGAEESFFLLPPLDWRDCPPGDIRERVEEAGIVGLGGAAFPTSVKLAPPKPVDTLVINGCECEPCLTADHRLMVEEAGAMAEGVLALARGIGVERVSFGIEENKPEAIRAIRKAFADLSAGAVEVRVEVLAAKYPQGAEKNLLAALLGREVPPGGLPMDVGAVVCNAGTALAVREAVCLGKPLYERVVTVSGRVARPANLRVRIGVSCAELIAFCGGIPSGDALVLLGGPMMGLPLPDLELPVTKGVSGLTVLGADELRPREHRACLRCGRCVDGCPMSLQPWLYGLHAERGSPEHSRGISVADCVECGVCTYLCPANRPNLHWIRLTKAVIRRAEKK